MMTPERRREIDRAIAEGPTFEGEYERELLIELLAELDRITALANEYAASVAMGPLACRKCGERDEFVTHHPLDACPLVLAGSSCREPERHHEFEPKEAL